MPSRNTATLLAGLAVSFLALSLTVSPLLAQPKPETKPATPPAKKPEEAKPSEKPKDNPAVQPAATPDKKDAAPQESKAPPVRAVADPAVLIFTMKDIDGKDVDLASFKGKVVLMVNVASKCGFTKQYKGLEALYRAKKDKGLVILAFPSNDFGGQEPGTESEIKEFCTSKYEVTFPLFSKIRVVNDKATSDKAHPLYQKLSLQKDPIGGEPKWNFTKFLVDRKGNAVARFDHQVKPDDEAFVKKIDELLAQK